MAADDAPLASLLLGLAMPELGATRENIQELASTKLDAYLSVEADEGKRAAAVSLRDALARWASPELTEEIIAAAQALLVAEGHGDARSRARRGAAWVQVITMVHDLALSKVREIVAKLDAYVALVDEEPQRAAALAMRAALVAWTFPPQPEAVTEAARAMLIVEDYATFHAELRKLCGPP